jgi:hypothetical protein
MDYVLTMAHGGAPTTEESEDLIASAVAANGTLHVFWVGEDGKTVWFRYQKKGDSDWKDGGVLTKSGEKLVGLSATTSASGDMELFARQADGNPVHTWQKANQSGWSGGQSGKQKAGFSNLPK